MGGHRLSVGGRNGTCSRYGECDPSEHSPSVDLRWSLQSELGSLRAAQCLGHADTSRGQGKKVKNGRPLLSTCLCPFFLTGDSKRMLNTSPFVEHPDHSFSASERRNGTQRPTELPSPRCRCGRRLRLCLRPGGLRSLSFGSDFSQSLRKRRTSAWRGAIPGGGWTSGPSGKSRFRHAVPPRGVHLSEMPKLKMSFLS